MAPLRTLAALAIGVSAVSGFAPAPLKRAAVSKTSINFNQEVFNDAMADWEKEYPQFAEWGWGPTVQAEKWNGRHAMFGWFFICMTGYAVNHGWIPDFDVPLDLKEWGTLATISGKNTITNGRAVILMANAHAFAFSLAATVCPPSFADPLLLDPNQGVLYERAKAAKPYGIMPAFKPGMTEEAEMFNGRMAMMGLITVIFTAALENKSILEVTNEWLGGLLG